MSALAVVTLVTGCGQQAPGVAASVNGETFSLSQVDDYASAVCEYGRTQAELTDQPVQPISGAQLRGFVLDLFVESSLTDQVADEVGVSVPASAAAQEPDAQTQAIIGAMPTEEGERVADLYSINARTTALQREVGTELLAQASEKGTADEADQRAAEAVEQARRQADIEIDPRLADDYAQRTGTEAALAEQAPLAVSATPGADPEAAASDGDVMGCS